MYSTSNVAVSMQTSFTLAQLADPNTAEAERILRACVHCGFCQATCPNSEVVLMSHRNPGEDINQAVS